MSKNKYRITELEEILRMKQMTLKSHLEAKLEAAGYEPKSTCDYFLSIHHLVSLYNVLVVSCSFQLSGVQIRTSESADVPGSTSW